MRHAKVRISLAATAFSLAACHSGGPASESQMTSYTASEAKSETASLFTVPPDQMAHVQVVPVAKTRIQRVLRFTGSVAYNAFSTTPVFTSVGGPVREILVAPGQTVRAGQPMLTVNSPDYSLARSTYMKAEDAYHLADLAYARAQDLYKHEAIAQKDLEAAESVRNQTQADLQSTSDALRALGVADPDSLLKAIHAAPIPLLAPVSGEVIERLVGPGQLLLVGATQCFTISDMSTVWVLANVYQSDLGSVHNGDPVDIRSDAYPDTFHGRISYLAAAVDPNTRTLQARIVTQNPGGKLKKDMYVTATVMAGSVRDAVIVPDAAVLRDSENQPFVYVQTASNKFARRLVTLGQENAGATQIIAGLQVGEHVAGDGSLFLQFKNSLQQ
jgi:cobalt-zinc-cadmium efflux system membrane fusion protein